MEHPNRRRHARFPYGEQVYIRNSGESVAECIDMSEGGVGFLTRQTVPPGAPFTIILFARSIAVAAVCRHQRRQGDRTFVVGAEFLEPQPELMDVVLRQTNARS